MATTLDTRGLLPSQAMMDAMGRRRHQNPKIKKTAAKEARWYFRYRVDVLVSPGQTEYVERTKHLGYCKDLGKREAERLRDEFLRTINRPDLVIQSQAPFGMILDRYLAHVALSTRPRTIACYQSQIRKHIRPRWGECRLCDITPMDMQDWILRLAQGRAKLTVSTVRTRIAVIWKLARRWGYTKEASPTEDITIGSMHKPKRSKALPTVDEFNKMLAILGPQLRVVASLCAFTGLRISEALGLSWADFSGDTVLIQRTAMQLGLIVEMTKTDAARRMVPVGHVRQMVLAIRPAGAQDSDAAFGIPYYTVRRRIKAAARALGIDYPGFGCHTFRRMHNTWFRRVASVSDAMEQLGHTSEAVNNLYNIEGDEVLQRRAEITAQLMGKVMGGVQ